MKLVIDRSKWARGQRPDSYLLRRRDSKMCCLGFFGLACGLTEAALVGMQEPREVAKFGKWPRWLVEEDNADPYEAIWCDSDAAGRLIEANDEPDISEADREQCIAAIFAENGVEVEFVDGTEEP